MYCSIGVDLDGISKVIQNLLLDAFWIIVCEVFMGITVLQWISRKSSITEKPEHLRYHSNFLCLKQHYWGIALYKHCALLCRIRYCPIQNSKFASWKDVLIICMSFIIDLIPS